MSLTLVQNPKRIARLLQEHEDTTKAKRRNELYHELLRLKKITPPEVWKQAQEIFLDFE